MKDFTAITDEQLFDYIPDSFNMLGIDVKPCYEIIKSMLGEWRAILIDQKGNCKVVKWSDEFRQRWFEKSWHKELSENGVPQMMHFKTVNIGIQRRSESTLVKILYLYVFKPKCTINITTT